MAHHRSSSPEGRFPGPALGGVLLEAVVHSLAGVPCAGSEEVETP